MSFSKVIIVTKPAQEQVSEVAHGVAEWFKGKGIASSTDPGFVSEADLCVVVGGDGTLLAAARLMAERQLPILAINFGSLGFLTEVTLAELYPALDRVLRGEFVLDERMMMDVRVVRSGTELAYYRALNDLVIHKGTLARMIELEARVDGHYISGYRSDGLIIGTPTGSTAYNLSSGGPIIYPSMKAMVITPISSHTLTNRPIVLPAEVKIEITLHSALDEVYATVDGQVGMKIEIQDRILIVKSGLNVKLIAPANKNYFDVLRGKLKWG